MSRRSQIIHLLVWIAGWVLICMPSFGLSIGIFNGREGGLWVPALYGSVINAILFYGHALRLIPRYLKQRKFLRYLAFASVGLIGLSLVESLIDVMFYSLTVGTTSFELFIETLEGNLLIHLIFFGAPSLVYGIASDWIKGSNHTQPSKESTKNSLLLKINHTLIPVKFADIRFLESQGNYVHVHTQDEKLTVRQSMTSIEAELPNDLFIRCHKSFIVAAHAIKKIDGDFVYSGGDTIPLGRKFKDKVRGTVQRLHIT